MDEKVTCHRQGPPAAPVTRSGFSLLAKIAYQAFAMDVPHSNGTDSKVACLLQMMNFFRCNLVFHFVHYNLGENVFPANMGQKNKNYARNCNAVDAVYLLFKCLPTSYFL